MEMHQTIYNPKFSLAYAGEKAFMGVDEVQRVLDFIQEGEMRLWSILHHRIRCQFVYKDGDSCNQVGRLGYNTCTRHRKFESSVDQELETDWTEGLEDWEISLVKRMIREETT